jgi:hypothetical protein
MSYRHTIEAGLESIREIEQLIKDFPQQGNIPVIELDLALLKIRNLYEVMLLLRQYQRESGTEPKREEVSTPPAQDEGAPEKEKTQDSVSGSSETGKTKPEKEASILSERFSGRTSLYDSIHETVVRKDGSSIGQTKPIASIAAAIGINDRFTFIRELFNNDTVGYEEAIKILDQASNFNEAYNYMIQQFDWDMDSETVQMLLDIIRRKHITGRHE